MNKKDKGICMNKELIINICGQDHKVFLQAGFFPSDEISNTLHKHGHTEIHIISGKNVEFRLGEKKYLISGEKVIVVPGGLFHSISREGETLHSAFQVDRKVKESKIHDWSKGSMYDFFKCIEECVKTGEYTQVSAYITLLCNLFCDQKKVMSKNITDYKFLISEFFANDYDKDVHLCDLARTLNLSERQTERLVTEYTGRTFREELTYTRVSMAKLLMDYSTMPLTQVAQYVGFRSYAGFWKAMRKENSEP